MKKFLKITTLILSVLTLIITFLYNHYDPLSYLEFYSILFFICLLYFTLGIFFNKPEYYSKNINIYMVIYFIALLGTTFFVVNRFLVFDISNFFNNIQLIPFNFLISILTNKYMNMKTLLFNYIGNFLMLTPLTILLVHKDSKFRSYKKTFLVLLIITFIIELSQAIFNLGYFDIDDFIFNLSGSMLFLYIYNKTKISIFLNKLFFPNHHLSKKVTFIPLIIMLILTILLDIFLVTKIIKYHTIENSNNYLRGITAERAETVTIDDYEVYVDNLLVIYKTKKNKYFEISETEENLSAITYNDLINAVTLQNENDTYKTYQGLDLYLYECQNTPKLIFSNTSYKEDYCPSS